MDIGVILILIVAYFLLSGKSVTDITKMVKYSCERCSYQFTVSQSIKDDPLEYCGIHCPIQDIGKIKRLISKNIYVIFW